MGRSQFECVPTFREGRTTDGTADSVGPDSKRDALKKSTGDA